MRTKEDLRRTLQRIDRKGYKAYKDIESVFDFREYHLFIDRAQGDPFASPSQARVRVGQELDGFPDEMYTNRSREVALRDKIAQDLDVSTILVIGGNAVRS